MEPTYIDAHMHFSKDKKEIEKTLCIIKRERVQTLAVSTCIPSYCQIRDLSKKEEFLDISFGIHPNQAGKYVNCLNEIVPYLQEASCIGEIGLCKYWAKDYEAQKRVFGYQIKYAAKHEKPVNLHTAGYEREIVEILKKYMPPAVLIHWYSGPLDVFHELNAMGCYFSFGVNLIANEADSLDCVKSDIPITRKILSLVPLNRILTETDGIDARKWIDGTSSYADAIPKIMKRLSKLLSIEECDMNHQIIENYRRFMGEKENIFIPSLQHRENML